MGNVTFEHKYVNAGFDYLDSKDQALPTGATAEGEGYSFWATPRKEFANLSSWELLLRYDHWTPNTSDAVAPAAAPLPSTLFRDQHQNRTIVGVAYWFPHEGNVSTAIMLDYDGQHFNNITTPENRSMSIHGLLKF